MTKIYSRYSVPPQVKCPLLSGSSVDKDSAKFTDINFIVQRYLQTDGASGFPVRSDYNKPIYGDFTKTYTIADAIALRENMEQLYYELSDENRSQYKTFNSFLKAVGSATDEEISQMFTQPTKVVQDVSTSTVTPAPDTSGVEASGSVQS